MEKTEIIKVLEKSWKFVIIYAEFEIFNMFFKERRAKYKPAFSKFVMFIPRFQFGHGNVV